MKCQFCLWYSIQKYPRLRCASFRCSHQPFTLNHPATDRLSSLSISLPPSQTLFYAVTHIQKSITHLTFFPFLPPTHIPSLPHFPNQPTNPTLSFFLPLIILLLPTYYPPSPSLPLTFIFHASLFRPFFFSFILPSAVLLVSLAIDLHRGLLSPNHSS